MKPFERKKLEKELYNTANGIVGNVGPEMDYAFIKSKHYDIAFFVFDCRSIDCSIIVNMWTEWVKAYCIFKKHHTPESVAVKNDPNLIVHWMKKPSIDIAGKRSSLKNQSFFRIRAYLLVDRLDLYPIGSERNVA